VFDNPLAKVVVSNSAAAS